MIRRVGLAVEFWCQRLCNRAATNTKGVNENSLLLVSIRGVLQRTIPVF
jgi:hypothetical protein